MGRGFRNPRKRPVTHAKETPKLVLEGTDQGKTGRPGGREHPARWRAPRALTRARASAYKGELYLSAQEGKKKFKGLHNGTEQEESCSRSAALRQPETNCGKMANGRPRGRSIAPTKNIRRSKLIDDAKRVGHAGLCLVASKGPGRRGPRTTWRPPPRWAPPIAERAKKAASKTSTSDRGGLPVPRSRQGAGRCGPRKCRTEVLRRMGGFHPPYAQPLGWVQPPAGHTSAGGPRVRLDDRGTTVHCG